MQLIDIAAIAGSLIVLGTVIGLIVRGRLKPRYALLWMAAACVLVLVSAWRGLIDLAGEAFGIAYKPAVVFLAADLFLMLIALHLSIVVSRLTDRIRDLAQKMALLEAQAAEPPDA